MKKHTKPFDPTYTPVRKMFFCYERSMLGRWQPVVYYDEVPPLTSGGKESAPTRSQVWLIPAAYLFDDEPAFGLLKTKFPPPAEPKEPENEEG